MIMIPAFMQRQLLEQGHSPPAAPSLYSPSPSSLAASTLVLAGVTESAESAEQSAEQSAESAGQSADMTADAIAMNRGYKNKRKQSNTIQKKPACMKKRPAAVISRGMPASDREELKAFLQEHSLHAAPIKIDLPTKVPRWGSAELFEGDCILFSALVCSTCEPSWSSLTHPLSDTLFIVMSWGKGKKTNRKLKNQLLQGGAAKCLWL